MPGGQYHGFITADKLKPLCPECQHPMNRRTCHRCGNTYLKSELENPHAEEVTG